MNPSGNQKGVKQITVDGTPISGTIIPWREHKHECRDIRGTGKVESAIAFPSEKLLLFHGKGTGIPLIQMCIRDRHHRWR